MRILRLLSICLALGLPAACSDGAADAGGGTAAPGEVLSHGALELEGFYARTSFPPHDNAAAFLTVRDLGGEGDALLGVAVDAAQVAELHTMEVAEGERMRMRKVERLEVPAGGVLELKPGADHLMFFDLAQPWAAGDTVRLTLRFEKAGEVQLEAPVRAL